MHENNLKKPLTLAMQCSCEFKSLIAPVVTLLHQVVGGGVDQPKLLALDVLDVLYEQGFTTISPIREYATVSDFLGADRYHWLLINNRTGGRYGDLTIPNRIKKDLRSMELSTTTQALVSRYLNGVDSRPSLASIDPLLAVPRLFAQQPTCYWDLAIESAFMQDESLCEAWGLMCVRGVTILPQIYTKVPELIDIFLGKPYADDYRFSACCGILTTYYHRIMFDKLVRTPDFPNREALLVAYFRVITFLCSEAFRVRL